MSLFKNNPNVNDTHTVGGQKYKWNGTTWKIVQSGLTGSVTTTIRTEFVATANQTTFDGLDYTPNYVDVYMNGIHLDSSDYAATDGLRVIMTSPVAVGTEIYVLAYGKFAVADTYTKAEADAKDAVLQGNINTNTTSIGNIPPATITEVSDQANTSTGYLDIPAGTTAQRPGSPNAGQLRFNTDFNKLENYSGTGWIDVSSSPPESVSVSPTDFNGESNSTFTLSGINYTSNDVVLLIGNDGSQYTTTVTHVGSTSKLFSNNLDLPIINAPYDIKVDNSIGSHTLENSVTAGNSPSWANQSILNFNIIKNSAFSESVSAIDPDGSIESYSSADIPSWASIDNSGNITGTTPDIPSTFQPGTPKPILIHNAPAHDTSWSKIGSSSIKLNNDLLRIDATHSDFNIGMGDLTVEFWFVTHSWGGDSEGIFAWGNQGTAPPHGNEIWWSNSRGHGNNTVDLDVTFKGDNAADQSGTTWTPSLNQWYHLALVRSGNTAKFYVDGSLWETWTVTQNVHNVGYIHFGGAGNRYNNCHMDEMRISNSARYNSNFTPNNTEFIPDSNTILLIHSNATNGSTTFNDDPEVVEVLGNSTSSSFSINAVDNAGNSSNSLIDYSKTFTIINNPV